MARFPEQNSLHHSLAYLTMRPHAAPNAWTPNTDVYETPERLVVRIELAGVDREDLEITLEDRLLIVRGHRKDPGRQRCCSFRQMEIDYGLFERRIVIPRPVDGSRVRAHFHNGFLQVELPNSTAAEPRVVTILIERVA